MLKHKTTIVLGAGASHEYGMPLGRDLKMKIGAMFSWTSGRSSIVDSEFQSFFEQLVHSGPWEASLKEIDWVSIANAFAQALTTNGSIDQLIAAHNENPQFVKLAKMCIAYQIAKGEVERGFIDTGLTSSRVVDVPTFGGKVGYLDLLWSILREDISKKNIDEIFRNLTVVSFNYDRIFQIGLYRYLVLSNLCDADKARKLVESIPVLFPYGSIRKWSDLIPYNVLSNHLILDEMSESILTFGESVDNQILEKTQDALRDASALVFLGFSFHKQNLRFFPDRCPLSDKIVLMTAKGLEKPEELRIRRSLEDRFHDGQDLRPSEVYGEYLLNSDFCTASELLAKYRTMLVDH